MDNSALSLTEPLEYFDISPLVSESIGVFPGDQPYRRHVIMDFKKGDNLVLSNLHTTVHLGAHVDAPSHYHPQGKGIDTRRLDYYLGGAQVVSVILPRGQRILPKHIAQVRISAKRVLFKTGSFPDPNRWNDDFNSLSAELIDDLAAKGVILVGIDTPSVDPCADESLETHHAVFRHDMANLEGIVLSDVPDGIYTLVALPLKLKDADATPVRAILIKQKL